MQMFLVLLTAQAGSIDKNFSCIPMCHNKMSCQKIGADKSDTINDMMFLWSSAEAQSVGRQLPVAPSNDTFYGCHVLPSQKHLHCRRVSKKWPRFFFIFTPFNEQSHSLNSFLLIDFYLSQPRCAVMDVVLWVLKSNPWWESQPSVGSDFLVNSAVSWFISNWTLLIWRSGGDNNEVTYQATANASCEDSFLLHDKRTHTQRHSFHLSRHDSITYSLSLAALAFALLICPAVNIDNLLLHWGHEAVLTFSSNSQLWVESRVLHMNYACLDARVLSNTSAIIIETIEKTIPDGSIIRQQEGETWSGRSPACPANLTTKHMEGTFTDEYCFPVVQSHMLYNMLKCGYVFLYVAITVSGEEPAHSNLELSTQLWQ